uniref:Glycinin subunit G7 n=1 Tax=Glycine max TaxID=3847 RepID=Q6DR94_SOYBN|nr:glycinin subunit G7 [Glycine max]
MFNHSALHYYFLLFFTCTCLARQQCQFKQECQLDTIHALKPDNLIESQGGVTETWNASHPELCCAGVAFIKRTINPNGLHLPSYVNYPELHFVLQGEGVLGIVIPGCDETFEEPQREREHDRHQKVRYLKQGDIFAVPPGIPYWTYNYANVSLVVITLLDTANFENQLDRVPRRFYLAGNPKEKHPCGRKQEEGNNINMFGGFDPRFLAEASNVKVGITKKLQSHIGDQIIKVEKGLSIIRPPLEHEVREAEVEEKPKTREHCECQKERKHKEGEGEEEVVQEKEIRKRKHHIGEHEGCGECENKEEEEQSRSRERGEWHEHKGQQHGKEKGRERYKEGGEGRERSNVLEEILCTLKLHENIADPSHADIFNPRAGRVRTINSLTLPVLKLLRLSAQWVKLYKSGIYVPHWSMNANSVAYVTSGGGWVQVVNSQGKSVFSGAVGRGRVVVVPQNFAVAIQAGRDGMEYIVFRTNDRAMMGTLVGPTSAITAIPGEVLANAFGLSPEEVSELKNNRKEAVLSSPASHHSPNPLIVTM